MSEIDREAPFLTGDLKVFIVQSGLSKARAETSQLELLAVTELYLKETYNVGLELIASCQAADRIITLDYLR